MTSATGAAPRTPTGPDDRTDNVPEGDRTRIRTVLLVSYTFPPQYDVSARRAAKLCKYLPAAGWRAIVLTKDWAVGVTEEDRRSYTISSHPEVRRALHDVTVVHARYRTHDHPLRRLHRRLGGVYGEGPTPAAASRPTLASGDNSRSTLADAPVWTLRGLARRALSVAAPVFGDFPDAFRGWISGAVATGVELVRRERVDAVCSLCPPATSHVVASEIARRTGIPWVAQFDDLYSFHLERQRASWRWYADPMHRSWMRRATLAGAITPAMLDYVRRTYGVDGDVVMVGFDPDDDVPREQTLPGPSGRPLRLAYTGSVYPGDQRPDIFFEGLDMALARRGTRTPYIEVVFTGTGRDGELRAMLEPFPLARAACTFVERVSPSEAHGLQRESDALLLFNCTAPSPDEGTLSFPAKAFEYLHAGRPILALPHDPGGWGDRLLDTTRAGITAGSAAEVAAVLDAWIDAWQERGTVPYHGDESEIARYSQPRQAAALGRLLDRAMDRRAR